MDLMNLRPDDFRRLWPDAVAVMMQDALRITGDLETTRQALSAQGEDLKEMALEVPKWVSEVRGHLKEVADKQVSRIEASHSEMLDTQRAFMSQFEAERKFFEGQRQDLANRLADVYRAQRELDEKRIDLEEKRREFNSLGFWKRIFAKA